MQQESKDCRMDFLRNTTNIIPAGFSSVDARVRHSEFKPITKDTTAKTSHKYRVEQPYIRYGNKILHRGDEIRLSYVDKKGYYFTVWRGE